MINKNDENITIYSPRFSGLMETFDQMLTDTLNTMEQKGGTEAEITLKLKIVIHGYKVQTDDGYRWAKIPSFEHKCASTMRLQSKCGGTILSDGRELVWADDTGWVLENSWHCSTMKNCWKRGGVRNETDVCPGRAREQRR